jgi:hypothetical protein
VTGVDTVEHEVRKLVRRRGIDPVVDRMAVGAGRGRCGWVLSI